jgi:hypothetical protein
MTLNVPHVPPGFTPSPKISGTCPVRSPFLFRAIVKRPAMTGSRLGRYVRVASPRVYRGAGGARAPARKFPGRSIVGSGSLQGPEYEMICSSSGGDTSGKGPASESSPCDFKSIPFWDTLEPEFWVTDQHCTLRPVPLGKMKCPGNFR